MMNFIHTNMVVDLHFLKAHIIPMSELKHEVFDLTARYS